MDLPPVHPPYSNPIATAMPRPVMLAGLLGAAVGVPYAVDRSGDWQSQWQSAPAASATPAETAESPPGLGASLEPPELPVPESPGSHLFTSPAPLEGIPAHSLAEVLRMDVSKDWVYSRWARKSTGLAEPDLFGIRVPIVTGTRMTDIAGSLTYYFNTAGHVEKLRLSGKTADTTELVNLLVTRYGFRPAVPELAGQQLYRVERRGRVESELRTWPAPVLWSTSPHDSFSVELEINRPGAGRVVERPRLTLQAVDQPNPPPDLFEQQQPAGRPVFPGEGLVPSSGAVKATPASTSQEVDESPPPKKMPPPALRWPG